MTRLRTISLAVALVLGVILTPKQAEAQGLPISFGVHVASALNAEDVAGNDSKSAFGLGARVGIDPPLLPVAFFLNGDYFFVDCGDIDCGYQNVGLDVNFNFLPLPIFNLYATGGLLVRRASASGEILGVAFDESGTATGFSLGAGVSFNFIASAYLEVRNEFFGDDDGGNQILVRLGLGF